MDEFLLSSFIDFAVYLLPGLIVVIAAIIRFQPDRLRHTREKLGFGELLLGLAAAYLIGMLTFRLSEIVIYPMNVYYCENPLEGIIRLFPEIDKLRESLVSSLTIKDSGNVEVYRYVKVIIQEKAPASAKEAERLMTISHLFRNLLLCMPLAFLIVWRPIKKQFGGKWFFVLCVLFLPLEFMILKTFLAFWSASVWMYLRAYIIWHSLG